GDVEKAPWEGGWQGSKQLACAQEDYSKIFSSWTRCKACTRLLTSSFRYVFFKCHFTVSAAMFNRTAISLLDNPLAIRRRTLISLSVKAAIWMCSLRGRGKRRGSGKLALTGCFRLIFSKVLSSRCSVTGFV